MRSLMEAVATAAVPDRQFDRTLPMLANYPSDLSIETALECLGKP